MPDLNDDVRPPLGRLRARYFWELPGGRKVWLGSWGAWHTNLVTNYGRGYFLDAADGAASRYLSNAQGGLLIGTGTTTPTQADSNLATPLYRAPFDSGYPTGSGTAARVYQCTIASGTTAANGQHTEFGLTNASSTALSDGGLITHLYIPGGYAKNSGAGIVYQYSLTPQ